MTIAALIDKQDTFEIVRDQIAAILATEVASQMALATAAAKDPDDWKLRIYAERANPWEMFLNEQTDRSPLVNVWYENSTFDKSKSNPVERQRSETTYNVDCYGYAMSADVVAGGHTPGDEGAALECQRALRLVRNILMAGEYTYLGLRGTVAGRWPQNISVYQPQIDNTGAQQIVAARLALNVSFYETSPQVQGETIETITATVRRAEDGQIVALTEYDYTP